MRTGRHASRSPGRCQERLGPKGFAEAPRGPWGPTAYARARGWHDGGFTYLGMLFFVAITAAALAALGQHWSTAAQRERERELEFRGQEIARAIESYLAASPSQPPAYPRSLDELLRDTRGIKPRHHLRRLYADPFTGQADWVLLAAPADPRGVAGVRSRSEQLLLRQLGEDASAPSRASDWQFKPTPSQAKPDPAASAASAAVGTPG